MRRPAVVRDGTLNEVCCRTARVREQLEIGPAANAADADDDGLSHAARRQVQRAARVYASPMWSVAVGRAFALVVIEDVRPNVASNRDGQARGDCSGRW